MKQRLQKKKKSGDILDYMKLGKHKFADFILVLEAGHNHFKGEEYKVSIFYHTGKWREQYVFNDGNTFDFFMTIVNQWRNKLKSLSEGLDDNGIYNTQDEYREAQKIVNFLEKVLLHIQGKVTYAI